LDGNASRPEGLVDAVAAAPRTRGWAGNAAHDITQYDGFGFAQGERVGEGTTSGGGHRSELRGEECGVTAITLLVEATVASEDAAEGHIEDEVSVLLVPILGAAEAQLEFGVPMNYGYFIVR